VEATLTEATCGSEWEQTLCNLIILGGDARCAAKEAADLAAEHKWSEAEEAMRRANEAQLAAHKIQADLLHRDARGEKMPFSILLVHSLDLLALAWAEIDFTEQFIRLNRRIAELEGEHRI
jgi:PTS system cellobiose-specific IIA component